MICFDCYIAFDLFWLIFCGSQCNYDKVGSHRKMLLYQDDTTNSSPRMYHHPATSQILLTKPSNPVNEIDEISKGLTGQ